MKYDNRCKFRHVLCGILNRSQISVGPLRESFISTSWQMYKSPHGGMKLFANIYGRNRYETIIKNLKKSKLWGNYLILITDGDPKRLF